MTSKNCNYFSIYLARHGQTFGNVAQIIADPQKDFLTPQGKSQAGKLAEKLENVNFTRVYCSNYPRAIQTTEIVVENSKHPPVAIIQDPRIREFEDTAFIGQPYTVLNSLRSVGEDDHPPHEFSEFFLKNCEPVGDVVARQDSFFKDLFSNLDKSDCQEEVLIVSHGCLMQLMMKHFKISQDYDIRNWVPELSSKFIENCTYHHFKVSKATVGNNVNNVAPRVLEFIKVHQ